MFHTMQCWRLLPKWQAAKAEALPENHAGCMSDVGSLEHIAARVATTVQDMDLKPQRAAMPV